MTFDKTVSTVLTEVKASGWTRCKNPKFLSGIYLKYLFCTSLSLYRCLKVLFFVDAILAIITLLSLIPIIQIDGKYIDEQLVVAIIKAIVLVVSLFLLIKVIFYKRMQRNSKFAYAAHVLLLLTTLLQDVFSLSKKNFKPIVTYLTEEEKQFEGDVETEDKIFLGWVIFKPVYSLWALELLYQLAACWVCLSAAYWINYLGLSKRQVLQIIKFKFLRTKTPIAE